MKTILAIIILASLLGLHCMAGDEPDVSQILEAIKGKELTQTISIDFQCDCYTSASNLPKDDISLRASKIRKEFPESTPGQPDDPKMEAALEQLADDYTTDAERGGTLQTINCTLILSGDFMALRTDKSIQDQTVSWEVRKGNTYYRYFEQNKAAVIHNKSNGQCEDMLEVSVGSVGLLGLMPKNPHGMNIVSINLWDKWLAELNIQSLSVWREGSNIHIAKGADEVTVEDLGNQQYHLRSFQESDLPYVPQFQKTSFDSYSTFGDYVLPSKVREVLCGPNENCVRIYTVKGFRHGNDVPLVPFVNVDLPLIQVLDGRYSPDLHYYAVGNLPDDEQIAEWIKYPKELEKYNRTMSLQWSDTYMSK